MMLCGPQGCGKMAIAMAFAGFVEVMTRSVVFFITYYIYGSIETQENEKNKFNKEIQNI